MAKMVTNSSLFNATAMGSRSAGMYKHVTDSQFAEAIARKAQTQGGPSSPHPRTAGEGPPVKRTKK